MFGYILKRLLLMVPTFFGILVLSFLIIRFAPGDPASQKFGGAGQATAGMNADRGTEDAEREFRRKFAFDKPLYYQFGIFLKNLATGDLVYYQTNQSIWPDLISALRITLLMNLFVFALTYVIAIPLGIYSSTYPNTASDRLITVGLFVLYSLPSFWVAELLRLWILQLGWNAVIPISDLRSLNHDSMGPLGRFWDYVVHLILPVACQTYIGLAYISRQMRAGMLEVIRQDYIRTAEAKGCSPSRVVLVHALRNSLFPIITLFASLLPALVGGSVIIEYIFNIQGMGLLTIENIARREYNFVMATLILSAVLTLLGILLSDILYVIVDPRVSFDSRR